MYRVPGLLLSLLTAAWSDQQAKLFTMEINVIACKFLQIRVSVTGTAAEVSSKGGKSEPQPVPHNSATA